VSLFAPDGTYNANSRPQGAMPNYANIDVRHPAAGTWSAVLYSSAAGGYVGDVLFSSTYQQAVSAGAVSPATFTLQPGASKNVKFSYTMPSSSSGDQSVALTLATSEGRQTSVSAVIRTVVDTATGDGAYGGVVDRRQRPRGHAGRDVQLPVHGPAELAGPAGLHHVRAPPEQRDRPGPDRPERRALRRRQQWRPSTTP